MNSKMPLRAKTRSLRSLTVTLLVVLSPMLSAQAQTTAFNFQGRLNSLGLPVHGNHDLRFTVYGSAAGADLISGPITISPVAVKNGVFNCRLDFGDQVYNGAARWLEIGVRPTGTTTFTNLSPRVELTSAPYAVRAREAAVATTVVNGAAVKSVNSLKDNVTLAAGPNVSITPSGNTLTIGATGGGGGGWSTVNNNTYFTNGNVGIGTNAPTSKVEIVGAQNALKINGYQPVMTLLDSSSFIDTAIQSTHGSLNLFSGVYLDGGNPFGFLQLNDSGRVGIGAVDPVGKLDIASASSPDVLRLIGPDPYLTLYDSAGGYTRSRLQSVAGSVSLQTEGYINGQGFAQGALVLKNGSGNVGISTDNPQHKLHIVGEGASGNSIGITGNATQNRDKGGWLKAMAKVNADGTIDRQFSAFGGTITAENIGGNYYVHFPFQVNDRYISVTPFANYDLIRAIAPDVELTGNTVIVSLDGHNVISGDLAPHVLNEFFIIVY